VTHRLFVLDVPENTSVARVAAQSAEVHVDKVGPYYVIESEAPIVIDRRETGCRHAVWYSCVAGLAGCRIVKWDKDALRAEAR
jgi:hypothetical protein